MIYYIHAYAPDTANFAICCAQLRRIDPQAVIVLANDPKQPIAPAHIPPGIHPLTPNYPTNGNLNGLDCIHGMLTTWLNILNHFGQDRLVKMDADTWLTRLDWLQLPGYDYISAERHEPFTPSGCCYMITRTAIDAAIQTIDSRDWYTPGWHYPEDCTIYRTLQLAKINTYLHPYPERKIVGYSTELPGSRLLNAACVHCGEPCPNGPNGPVPCPRAIIQLRLALMWQATYPSDPPILVPPTDTETNYRRAIPPTQPAPEPPPPTSPTTKNADADDAVSTTQTP